MYTPEPEVDDLPPVVEGHAAAPAEGEKILGKYSTTEELAKGHQDLEQLYGKQTAEVGDLRKANQVLLSQMELAQQAQQARQAAGGQQQEQEATLEDQLVQIQQQVNAGDIDPHEAMRLTAIVTRNDTLKAARSEYSRLDRERTTREIQDQFIRDNPGFLEAQRRGVLGQIRQSNPLHDDFSAYFAHKADQEAIARGDVEKTAYERGKAEVSKLAQGTEAARKVLANPGTDTRNANPSTVPLTDAQIKASMLTAVSRRKQGG